MSEVSLVPAGTNRVALHGLVLPEPPPTRVYISGREFQLAAPRVPLPPLVNTVKVILNWANNTSRIAKNVFYLLTGGSFVSSDVAKLQLLANQLQTILATATPLPSLISDKWTLLSTTCKDNGGTTAQASSTSATAPGTNAGTCQPPQVSIAISWQIAESYRGGKPRWYLPGVPATALVSGSDSGVLPSYATSLEACATTIMNQFNSITITGGGTFSLGTISYHSGHAVRPTPLFRTFINAKVHERLDSQRRRSGRESAFGVIP